MTLIITGSHTRQLETTIPWQFVLQNELLFYQPLALDAPFDKPYPAAQVWADIVELKLCFCHALHPQFLKCQQTLLIIFSYLLSATSPAVSARLPIKFRKCDINAESTSQSPFSIAPINEEDVKRAISALKSPATSSEEKMSLRLLKLSFPVIAAPLAEIFNLSIMSSTFPEA